MRQDEDVAPKRFIPEVESILTPDEAKELVRLLSTPIEVGHKTYRIPRLASPGLGYLAEMLERATSTT